MGPGEKSYEELAAEISDLRRQLSDLGLIASRLRESEEALKLDEARLEALLELTRMTGASEQEIADYALEAAVQLTGSEVGWMGALENEEVVNLYNFSSQARKECDVTGRPHSFYIRGGGIWRLPITERKPIILNAFAAPHPARKGFPEGHVELRNFLAVPVFDGDRVVAIAEVGNKKTDYDRSDVRQLTLLMNDVWRAILRRRTEEALLDSKQQAELYVDLMGHDINNMNQIALGFLELALQRLDENKKLGEEDRFTLEKPIETLQNSATLIHNVKMLQQARAGSLKARPVDLDEQIARAISEFAMVPGRKVTIDYTPGEGRLVTANDLLKDVFSNIVGNAIKHSPPDKPLNVGIRVMEVKEGGARYYAVMIEDDGPGIPDERKAMLFTRMKGDRKTIAGASLGMGLVRTLTEDFGGRVWAEDRVSGDHTKGVRFVVMLPAAGARRPLP
ncbi:MAG: adaptive-response sensory kinase [Methanocella sp. PtaU1.Bin125]|nr:MAG: adaptive-response sensory kinase [Methanocella sp. PtaU1.Bin125]